MNFRVTQAYQNLEPDFGNQVNVTLVLAVNSQVSSWHWFMAIFDPPILQTWQAVGAQAKVRNELYALWLSIKIICKEIVACAFLLVYRFPWHAGNPEIIRYKGCCNVAL